MTKAQQIREYLFKTELPSEQEHKENFFRLLHVVEQSDLMKITYAITPATWDRAELRTSSCESYIRLLLQNSPFKNENFKIQEVSYRNWNLPWSETEKSSNNNFPMLVLMENEGGSFSGVLMRNSFSGDVTKGVAECYYEEEDVSTLIYQLQNLKKDEMFHSLYKESDITNQPFEEILKNSPLSDGGQVEVFRYVNYEWKNGIYNTPKRGEEFKLPAEHNVANFFGLPVSRNKINERCTIETVIEKQTIPGNVDVLERALKELEEYEQKNPACYSRTKTTREDDLPIATICEWWNQNAPESMRDVRLFRTYSWNEDRKIFIAGDYEEPAILAKDFAGIPSYSIFKNRDGKYFAFVFFKGSDCFVEKHGFTQTFYADGSEAWEMGERKENLNEAFYSIIGLRHIKEVTENEEELEEY